MNDELRIMKNWLIGLLVVLVLIGSILVQRGNAQEAIRTFTIVPPTVAHTLDAGRNAEGTMKVINDSSTTLSFTATINDFVVNDNNGTPSLLAPNILSKKFGASSWIAVYPQNFTIPPHEKQLLNYYVQVPPNARPGGHYAAVVFTPSNSIGVNGTGASVETKAGSLFYISVNGLVNEYSIVSKFFANRFQEYGPVKIETSIKNRGDLHIKPIGTITITDLLGIKIETQNLAERNIFPDTTRDYNNQFGQKIMIGRFKASLLASYGVKDNLPLMSTVYFWVFPWKLAVIITLAIIAMILGLMYLKKRKRVNDESKISTPPTTNDVKVSHHP